MFTKAVYSINVNKSYELFIGIDCKYIKSETLFLFNKKKTKVYIHIGLSMCKA